MKNLKIFTAILLGVFAIASCEEQDREPVFQEPTEFVLNTPSCVNGVYDLDNSTSFVLTCSQPDYGFTAATTYTVEMSLYEDFIDASASTGEEIVENFEVVGTSTKAKIEVSAANVAVALTNLAGGDPEDYPKTVTAYVRVRAVLTKSGKGEIVSNIVTIPAMKFSYSLPPVNAPEDMYLIGAFNDWAWDKSNAMVKVNGNSAESALNSFWQIVWLPENCGMKFNSKKLWDGNETGYAGCTVKDNASAGVTSSDDGNIVVGKAGWYLVVIDAAVNGRDLVYTISFNVPKIYLFGKGTAGDSWSAEEANVFTIPDKADGEFISPAFDEDLDGTDDGGCVRACVVLDGHEWWHTEFIVLEGKIVYRETGGDQDRVGGKAGQRLYLKFSDGTGSIK